jgi:DNA-binding NtrC family response regulator
MILNTNLTREKQTATLQFDHSWWRLTVSPYEDSVILYFEKAFKGEVSDLAIHTDLQSLDLNPSISYAPIAGKSEHIQKILRQIDQYSGMKESVWIMGEEGNGKELIAQSLYLKRRGHNGPFITLHCDRLSEEMLKSLIDEGFFRKYAGNVVYLKGIDHLNVSTQNALYQFLKNVEAKTLKWIVTCGDSLEEKMKNNTFKRDLYDLFAQLKIYIPPLRERSEDIEKLVHVFISELHPKYGNEVVGIRQDAVEELARYNWPGNVEQLKQVVEQLVLRSKSFYIEKKEVEKIISQLKQQPTNKNAAITAIDISGTLEDIEKQVIIRVLEEEDMNQSRAAKRLGINRSTLWRKLK